MRDNGRGFSGSEHRGDEGGVSQDRLSTPKRLVIDGEEGSLRPGMLAEFIGQKDLKKQIGIYIKAARSRGDNLDHVLLSGPPGLGKTTLASIIAHELGVGFKSTSAPAIERQGDLAAILSGLKSREVLFIDEIHRLKPILEEVLYPALEDYTLDFVIGQGPGAKSIKIRLQHFTLIGATTRAGLLSAPLRARFGITQRIDYYGCDEIVEIVRRSAGILNISITDGAAKTVASRARGTPRIANRILRRLRDFAQVEGDGRVDEHVAEKGLNMLGLDVLGLDGMDKRVIDTIITKYGGGPVGVETIAVSVGEDRESIEDVYEPYLIQIGFIQRTPKGRVATKRAYEHFGYPLRGAVEGDLF
jgi:holliday junction DNA helicase RuvB